MRANSSAPQEFNSIQVNAISNDEEASEIVAALLEEGIDAYGKRQISRAIDHFSRAMLLDPSQETARRYLIQINRHRGLSAQQRAELFLFEDLAAFLDELEQKRESLIRKCDELMEEAVRAGGDRPLLESALDQEMDQFYFSDEGWDVWDDTRPPLEALNAALMNMKKELLDQLSFLQEKSAWLTHGKWKVATVIPALTSDDKSAAAVLEESLIPTPRLVEGSERTGIAVETVSDPVATRAPALNQNRFRAVQGVAAPNNRGTTDFSPWGSTAATDEIALLRDELRELKKEVGDLHAYVQAKDAKIAHLSDQVVAFSLKLAEQEMVLSEKARLTDTLREQYSDLESRFELGQKIIQEKNTQIQSLQDGLASLQAEAAVHQRELSDMLVFKDGEVNELIGIVRIYKDKLAAVHDRLKRKQMSISDLESTVEAMRVTLFEKETALNKTKERMSRLEQQLHNAQMRSGQRFRKSSLNRIEEETPDGRLGLEWMDSAVLSAFAEDYGLSLLGSMPRPAGGME